MNNQAKNIGVLLTNIGTPTHPTRSAVRQYLKEFLSDRRVIQAPRFLWWPLLHGIILPLRSRTSAKLYQKIWRPAGPPLLIYSHSLAQKLQTQLNCPVVLGMHYGRPSIEEALQQLLAQPIKKIIVLPLFPQYSATTTASSFDKMAAYFKKSPYLPEITWLNHYATEAHYIRAISQQIQQSWEQQGQPQHIVFSFHGIPQRYADAGDIYPTLCYQTADLVLQELAWPKAQATVAFQSRLGRLRWLTPYTDKALQTLPQQGIQKIQVVCPGFAVDCLETLEEIAIRGKKQFLKAGGKLFHYVSALNDQDEHVEVLARLIVLSR